jgi:hypothetical protein
MSGTREKVAPILHRTYGKGGMVDALADHLATQIDAYPTTPGTRSRQDIIMLTCWDWFSGGDTANHVAEQIEAVL